MYMDWLIMFSIAIPEKRRRQGWTTVHDIIMMPRGGSERTEEVDPAVLQYHAVPWEEPSPTQKKPKHICHCQKSQTTTWKKHKYTHSCFQGPLTQPNSCWETHTHTHKMGWVWRQRNVSLHRLKQPPRPHTSTIWAPFSPQTQDGSVNMATKTQHVSLSAETPVMSSSWLNLWHW